MECWLREFFAADRAHGSGCRRTLSESMGHTNVSFTMQRYAHTDSATEKKGMEYLVSLI